MSTPNMLKTPVHKIHPIAMVELHCIQHYVFPNQSMYSLSEGKYSKLSKPLIKKFKN